MTTFSSFISSYFILSTDQFISEWNNLRRYHDILFLSWIKFLLIWIILLFLRNTSFCISYWNCVLQDTIFANKHFKLLLLQYFINWHTVFGCITIKPFRLVTNKNTMYTYQIYITFITCQLQLNNISIYCR